MNQLVAVILSLSVGIVLGAGFALAARWLLFHPRRPLVLFGRRLPFSPGLFEKLKPGLARAVGELFERELVSGELLASRLADPGIRADLVLELRQRLDNSLSQSTTELLSGFDKGRDAAVADLARQAASNLIKSREFSSAMALALGRAMVLVEDIPLSLLLPPSLARSAAGSLLSPENLARFEALVSAWIDGTSPGPEGGIGALVPAVHRGPAELDPAGFIAGIIPADSLEPLVELLVEGLYSASIPVVERFLNDSETRRVIEGSALEMVRRAIARLNVVQRLIVGAANYERSIAETMPDTVEDLVSMVSSLLRSPAIRSKTRNAAIDAWQDYFSQARGRAGLSIASFISRESAHEALEAVIAILGRQGPRLAERAAHLVSERPDATLGSLFSFAGISGSDVATRKSIDLSSLLSLEGSSGSSLSRGIEGFVVTLLGDLASKPLAPLFGADTRFSEELADWLADRSLELVSAESARIIQGLELREALSGKILAMSMPEAERAIGPALGKGGRVVTFSLALLGGIIGLASAGLHLILGR